MGLETASHIADLNSAWPLGSEGVLQGDDHLRLIKGCLQSQFPNLGTTAFVNPTETEFNHLVGVTSGVQGQLDTLSGRITSNDGDIATLTADLNQAESDIGVLDSRVNGIEAELPNVCATIGQRFVCFASGPPGNGKWSIRADINDRVPLIQTSYSTATGGSWTISGLSNSATGATALGSHNHPDNFTVTHDPATATFSGGALDVSGSESLTNGNDGELFNHNVLGGVTDTNLGSHSHPGSTISSNATWRMPYRHCVLLQYDG